MWDESHLGTGALVRVFGDALPGAVEPGASFSIFPN